MNKGKVYAFLVIVYGLVFSLVHILHFRMFTVDVILYSASMDAALALILVLLPVSILRGKDSGPRVLSGLRQLSIGDIWLLALCLLLMGYAYSISIPTVIDRSFSIYILTKIEQQGGQISIDSMSEQLIWDFLEEYRLVDARLTEQTESGTVEVDDSCVSLTRWGEVVVSATRFYRHNLLPRNRVLMGDVSDALVEPLKHSRVEDAYRCKQQSM